MEHMLSHEEQSSSEATGPFSCTECDEQFNLKINLDLHVVCVHEARLQAIRCKYCTVNTYYESREGLIEHLKSTHGDTVYSCKHCPTSYVSFEEVLTHMLKHTGTKKFMCPECVAVCTTVKELHEHCFQAHPQLKETYKCERCDKVYLAENSLLVHMKLEHDYDRKSKVFKTGLPSADLTCVQCKSEGKITMYKTESALQRHITDVHVKKKSHKCGQCEDRFFRKKCDLRRHVKIVHENFRFLCSQCPRSYTERRILNDHLKTHTREDLLICEICSKEYTNTHSLRRHMEDTHATVKKQVVCEECGKEFLGDEKLKRHKYRVHQKEKRVVPKCPICGRTFSQAYNLKIHYNKHSGQKPFKCPICKKCLSDKGVLKTHLKGVHRMEAAAAEETLKKVIVQKDS